MSSKGIDFTETFEKVRIYLLKYLFILNICVYVPDIKCDIFTSRFGNIKDSEKFTFKKKCNNDKFSALNHQV